MSKTEKPEKTAPVEAPAADTGAASKPAKDPKAPKPERDVDNKANAQKFKSKWDEMQKQDSKGRVQIPGTRKSVAFSHVEVVDNKVSIWTSSDKSGAPDFIVVNGPTEIVNESGVIVEDPLTAIAIAIDGASS